MNVLREGGQLRRRSSRLTPPLPSCMDGAGMEDKNAMRDDDEGRRSPVYNPKENDLSREHDEDEESGREEQGKDAEHDGGKGEEEEEDEEEEEEEEERRPRRTFTKKYTTRLRIAKQRSVKETKALENYVGRRVLRYFDGEPFFGDVKEFLAPEAKMTFLFSRLFTTMAIWSNLNFLKSKRRSKTSRITQGQAYTSRSPQKSRARKVYDIFLGSRKKKKTHRDSDNDDSDEDDSDDEEDTSSEEERVKRKSRSRSRSSRNRKRKRSNIFRMFNRRPKKKAKRAKKSRRFRMHYSSSSSSASDTVTASSSSSSSDDEGGGAPSAARSKTTRKRKVRKMPIFLP